MTYTDEQLEHLEGVMLKTYQRELGLKLADPVRLQELYGSAFWDADKVLKLNSICATACQLLDTPSSEINLITDTEQVCVASYGALGLRRVELERSYCQHVVAAERPLSIGEATKHALVCRSSVTMESGIRAYLGVPLITARGYILGSLCTWTYEPRMWTDTEVSMLASLASVVMRFEGNI
jgi:signal transduction protein with GAF and PtsI domain